VKSIRRLFLLACFFLFLMDGFIVFVLLEFSDLSPVIIILIVLTISTVAIAPFLKFVFPREIKDGIEAQAKVLKVWDTGVSINNNPQIGLLLEISPEGGDPIQIKAKMVVSRLDAALVKPGITAEVIYNSKMPKRLRVLTFHLGGDAHNDNATRLEELESLRDKGLITREEYQQKRKEILKSL
jgi:hypothetical protein